MKQFLISALILLLAKFAFANSLQQEMETRIANGARAQAQKACADQQKARARVLMNKVLKKVEATVNATVVSREESYFKFSNGTICRLGLGAAVSSFANEIFANLGYSDSCIDTHGRETQLGDSEFYASEKTCDSGGRQAWVY